MTFTNLTVIVMNSTFAYIWMFMLTDPSRKSIHMINDKKMRPHLIIHIYFCRPIIIFTGILLPRKIQKSPEVAED